MLVRLLSAVGSVRVLGHTLARPVKDPARALRRTLQRSDDGPLTASVVLPHHLWLVNGVDPTAFVGDLVADGITVISLRRAVADDRGLSLALCGPRSEVLPPAPRLVDAGEVALYAREHEHAPSWFAEVCPRPEQRFVFEDDLADASARQASAGRLAEILGLDPWDAPPDHEVPDHDTLWRLVHDAEALRANLARLREATRA